MRYRFTDGKSVEAETPEEFVTKMRNSSYAPSEDEEDFMELCSERAERLGVDIRTDNADNFLHDLIHNGIVTLELEPPLAAGWN
jgi:hypothetical protein